MDILFVSRKCLGARAFGSDTRTTNVVRWLAETGRRVHFVHLTRDLVSPGPTRKLRSLLASYHPIHIAGRRARGLEPLQWRALTRPRSWFAQRWMSRWMSRQPLGAALERLLDRTGAQTVWCDHAYIAPALIDLPRRDGVLWVVDTHDVMHLRDASFQARGLPPEHEVSREEEQHLLSAFDVIVAIQDHERKVFERMLPQRTAVTVGHALEISPQPCTTSDIGFVGSRYPANEAALLSFLHEAWPAIRARCPGARVQVAGGVCQRPRVKQMARADSRIVLRGVVGDVRQIYAGPAVMICPLWMGSGLKIKMVEALAHGKAVVGTPVAAQGLEDGIDDAFRLVHRAAEFAEPVVELLDSAAHRESLERGALRYANDRFSKARVWSTLDRILREGVAQPRLARAA
jgi:glycosyltransferase involved in cell wall biosynthesis